MKKVLYISTALSDYEDNFLNLKKKKKNTLIGGMPQSANKFHRLFIEGLENNKCQVTGISGRNISFKSHHGVFYKTHIEERKHIKRIYPFTINIPIVKQIFNAYIIKRYVKKWLKNNCCDDKFILIDASYVSVLPSVVKVVNKECMIVSIFADLYDYMTDFEEKTTFLKKIIKKKVQKAYSNINGYIFLTEEMNEKINKHNKPYIVIEGIVDNKLSNKSDKKNPKDVLMYAGSLQKKFGLDELIEQYMKYKNNNSELWIYGDGDYRSEIEFACSKDKRIKYFGNVNNNEIIKREKEACFLINPRNPKYEFTKYSFPSKNMEYMLSGTPMIGYKLPGIPNEYDQYIIYINGNSENRLLDTFKYCFNNKKDLSTIGKNAQKFVLENKNKNIQTLKIIEFIENIKE